MELESISIIIPVYNAEKYIKECLDSILAVKNAEIEVIAVDDESKDNSLNILKEYERQDKRLKVFNKKNSGVSATRNFGIEKASGKWIAFIDCDDKFDTERFDEFISNIDDNMDIMMATFSYLNEEGTKQERVNFIDEDMLTAEDFVLNFQSIDFQMQTVWCKLYKNQIIKEKNIRFESSLFNAEDGAFNMDYYQYVNKARCMDIPIYFYRIREDSSIHHVTMPENGEACFKHYIGFIEYMSQFNKFNIKNYPTLAGFLINMGAINKIAAVAINNNRSINEIREVVNNIYVQQVVHSIKPEGMYRKMVYKLIADRSIKKLVLIFRLKNFLLKNKKLYFFVKKKTAC